jgi:hypothetical protein
VGSFNIIKSDEVAIENWFKNEYPKPVIEQDLLKIMRERKLDISEEHHKLLHEWLSHPSIRAVFPENEKKLY